jgi:hypothetical protein
MLYLAIGTWRKPSQYPKPGDRRGEIAFDFFTLLRHVFFGKPAVLRGFRGCAAHRLLPRGA